MGWQRCETGCFGIYSTPAQQLVSAPAVLKCCLAGFAMQAGRSNAASALVSPFVKDTSRLGSIAVGKFTCETPSAQSSLRPADGDWHWQHLKALSSAEPRLQWLGTSDRWGLPTPGAKVLPPVPHLQSTLQLGMHNVEIDQDFSRWHARMPWPW